MSGGEAYVDEASNLRAFAIVIAGLDALVVAIILATTARPFATSGLTLEGMALFTLLAVFALTAVPAALLALRSRWFKTAAVLALSFPVLLVALFIVALSMLD